MTIKILIIILPNLEIQWNIYKKKTDSKLFNLELYLKQLTQFSST